MGPDAVISGRMARTLYNVADALRPAVEGEGGGGDYDLVPGVAAHVRHRGVPEARRLWLVLALVEWGPWFALRPRRFSALPLPDRRERLERWRTSRLALRRRAHAWLETWVDVGIADARAAEAQSDEGL